MVDVIRGINAIIVIPRNAYITAGMVEMGAVVVIRIVIFSILCYVEDPSEKENVLMKHAH